MAVSQALIDRTKELFAPFGEIRVKRMFGGAGVYCDELFFAILADGVVYFKVDNETQAAFEREGSRPFEFEMKDGSKATMSYYDAPSTIHDDEHELRRWTVLALDAARRSAKFRKKSRPQKKAARRQA